ncbi:MAG: hypothetical protein ACMUJM_13540 [bacterium]
MTGLTGYTGFKIYPVNPVNPVNKYSWKGTHGDYYFTTEDIEITKQI